MSSLPDGLLETVRRSNTLCLNVNDPGWDDARGYLFHEPTDTLYFPVSKKYLPSSLVGFQVLIWSKPRVLATGNLSSATSDDDLAIQLALAVSTGMEPDRANYMLLDQRNNRPRKTRYKLAVRDLIVVEADPK